MTWRPTLGLDLDCVLLDIIGGIKAYARDSLGVHLDPALHQSYSIADWISLCCEDEATRVRVNTRVITVLRGDNHVYANLEPLPGAVEAVWMLSEHFNLCAITSRPACLRTGTMVSLSKHFPRLTQVHYTKNKPSIAKATGCVAVMEDHPETVEAYLKLKRLHVFYIRHPRSGQDIRGRHSRLTEVPSALDAAKRLVSMRTAMV